ncbi:MAG: M20/M25/M40 family metallo-hydrolase [Candidatus Sericytochromatia bacterium]
MNIKLKETTQELKNQIVSFAQQLIQTPSQTGDEKNISELILEELKSLNYDECFIDNFGNVIGIIKGNTNNKSIGYISNMDHKSPDKIDDWFESPNSGKIINDYIYGIGSNGSKGAIASQIYAGYILKKLDLIKNDYVVAFSVQKNSDTCFGIKNLFEDTFVDKNINLGNVILGYPTSLNIYLGQRGRTQLQIDIIGRTSLSAVPWLGISPLNKLGSVIRMIENLTDNLPSHTLLEESTLAITSVNTYPNKDNFVPDRCILKLDRWFLNNETIDEVRGQIQAILNKLMGEDHTFKAVVEIQTQVIKSYTGYTEELPKFSMPFLTDVEDPIIKKIYNPLREVQENINFGAWYGSNDGGYISCIKKIPLIGYAPGNQRYCDTPFDKIKIDDILTATIGNCVIYNSLCLN